MANQYTDPMLYIGSPPHSKRCSICRKHKRFDEYYKSKTGKYGIRKGPCNACRMEHWRKYKNCDDRFWKTFWDRTNRTESGCLEWGGRYEPKHYPVVERNYKKVGVRRVVWQLRFGEIPEGMVVLMRCRNRRCVSQFHMYLGTKEDQEFERVTAMPVGDAHPARRMPERLARGERHWNAKLTTKMVGEIRRLCADGMQQKSIAELFGIDETTVSNIHRRKTWAHVE